MKQIILSALCFFTALSNYAEGFDVDGYYYNIISMNDRTVQLTCSGPSSVHNEYGEDEKFTGNPNTYVATYSGDDDGNFVVPQTVEYEGVTFTVTSINTLAFVNCVINTLTIPETVEEVAMELNSGTGLQGTFKRLVIEDSKKPIKCYRALVGPTNRTYWENVNWTKDDLEEFAKTVPSNWEQVTLTFYWIYDGGVTESVYLGRQIEHYDQGFVVYGDSYNMPSYYKEIDFGENVKSLSYACAYNKELTSVTLPSSIESLSAAFVGCTALESIVLPSTVKNLTSAFSGCTALKSIDAPGVETISGAFSGCTSLETVNLPMLRTINSYSFRNCTALKSIAFAPGLVSLKGQDIFSGSSVESIIIPSTVVRIGEMGINYNEDGIYYDENFTDPYYNNIFTDCSSLKTITVCNPTPIMLSEKNFDQIKFLTATLKVPVGSAEAYRNAYVWKNFFKIEEDESITNEIFTVTEDDSNDYGYYYGSSIEFELDEAFPTYKESAYPYKEYKFVKKGEDITIKAVPYDRTIALRKLFINEVDVIEEVNCNVYTSAATSSMIVRAEFDASQREDVSIPDATYTAYVTKFDTDFFTYLTDPYYITAYKVTEASTSGVTLEPIEAATEGTAVILQGYPHVSAYIYEMRNKVNHPDNLLKVGGDIVGDGKTIYALGNKERGVGFYLVAEGVAVPADKGYLVINSTSEAKAFIPIGDEATSIEQVADESTESDVIYNLAGQRITEPTQSGIYIVNGKKVFINK